MVYEVHVFLFCDKGVLVMKYELIMYFYFILKHVPGLFGCKIRKYFLPGRYGRGVTIWDMVHIDNPKKLVVGDNSSINRGCFLNCDGGVEIGKDVLIGPGVVMYSKNHNFKNKNIPIREQGYTHKKVIIGDDVWIASGCIILPGVVIGDGVVVGAGSVVSKNLDSYGVYVGIPAKLVSYRE